MHVNDKIVRADEWQGRALCRDRPDLDFFPEVTKNRAIPQRVAETCAACPVSEQCLNLALSVPEIEDQDGIFAGLTPAQRGEIRKFYKKTHNGQLIENQTRRFHS